MNKLLQRILLLSIKISMETDDDVMMDWAGHVKEISVRVHKGGSTKTSTPKYYNFYTDREGSMYDAKVIIKRLERILSNAKLEVAA